MKNAYIGIIAVAAAMLSGACSGENLKTAGWDLTDTDVCIRCGEVYELPFSGGSADYTIHNPAPQSAEVMAVSSGSRIYPGHSEQALVFRGKSKGESKVTVKDNKSSRTVCIRLRVVDPYIALLGTPHTDPERSDNLLAWDTNLYLNADGRFILTTFTDGMAVKPALITRGSYTVTPVADGFNITITPSNLKLPPQTYHIDGSGALAQVLASWNIDRRDSDLDMCNLANLADGRSGRYWLTPSEHLPSGMAF